jgi:hypothetical protein
MTVKHDDDDVPPLFKLIELNDDGRMGRRVLLQIGSGQPN